MPPTRNQPSFDFLTGEPISQGNQPTREPLRETLRQSSNAKPDIHNEDLRAQINTLQYELESQKQERELETLRYQQEVRDAQSKADLEFKRAQDADKTKTISTSKYEALQRELQDLQTTSANQIANLDKEKRRFKDRSAQLEEEIEEAKSEVQSLDRQWQHKFNNLQAQFDSVKAQAIEAQDDATNKTNALQITQQRLTKKEEDFGKLESELIQLKGQSGDSDELAVVRRELSEQVGHIKKLEAANRDQMAELKRYQKNYKSVEVVEEEKRALESKLTVMNELRRELGEVQLRKQSLEDERNAWASYLESESASQGDLQFESPEDLARAYIRERLETAALMDRLGKVQPELMVRDENIKTLEDEKAALSADLEKLRDSINGKTSGGDNKARLRIERQRNLAVKEAEYLRAQLNAMGMDEDDAVESQDAQKSQRIQELESIVEQYRNELQTINKELADVEKKQESPLEDPMALSLALSPKKRQLDSQSDERLGELTRKNRDLQMELTNLQKRATHLETDLKAATKQITSLKSSSRTRILELRSNPTAHAETVKLSTIKILRDENAALLARLRGDIDDMNSVPTSSLLRSENKIAELEASIASAEKRTMRLKQIWSAKAGEFREAVASLLGFKMDFMPNGRVRVTSMFHPGEEDSGENSIVFDGEKGEMKVSGGPRSKFASEIRGLIDFWVDERKEIPCFLAAMTLEFHERSMAAKEEAAAAKKG